MIRLINILGILFGFYFLFKSYLLVKKKEEDVKQFLLWGLIGIILVILGIYPNLADIPLRILNMGERINVIFTMGILLSILLIFNLNNQIKKMDAQISKLNEEIAILKYKGKKKFR